MLGMRLLIDCEASWRLGWALVLSGMVSGAAIGAFFLREGFWGGYSSRRRRLVRLGHVALVALGLLLVAARASAPSLSHSLLALGAVLMPAACFATAWRVSLRVLF